MIDLDEIQRLMKLSKIKSYNELSKKSLIPYSTLLNIINSKDIRISSLIDLGNFFKVSVADLIKTNNKYYINILKGNEFYKLKYNLEIKSEEIKQIILENYLLKY